MTISDSDAERAADFLRDSAEDFAQARADRVLLEEGRKRVKAIIMAEHNDKPLAAQEREAYRDARYETHLKGLREAVYREQKAVALRDAALARIDYWRSMSANQRGRM